MYSNVNILAPFSVYVKPKSTDSVTAILEPSPDSPGVTLYKVSGGGQSCEILASGSPLSCDLGKLQSGTQFTVQAVACLANAECSIAKSASGYTLPDGNINLMSAALRYFDWINLLFLLRKLQRP